MHAYHHRLLAVGAVLLLTLTGCAAEPGASSPESQAPSAGSGEQSAPAQEPETAQDPETEGDVNASAETTIPAGAYAASAEFPFPIPDGWGVIYPFTEGKLGKDVSMDASIEYPGDAKDAAASYLSVLTAAGFEAGTYGPGELTNQASLYAKGRINGISYSAILNFDVHADGLQHVSITAVEND